MPRLLNTRQAGLATYVDPGSDKPFLEIGTLQCCHCGGHWLPIPGSGKVRGFCQRCNGFVCGPGCAECVPMEQYLENMEKGVPEPDKYRPIIVPTSFHGEE